MNRALNNTIDNPDACRHIGMIDMTLDRHNLLPKPTLTQSSSELSKQDSKTVKGLSHENTIV